MMAAVLFYVEILETVRTLDKENFYKKGISLELKDKARCNRWRAERNFWISLLSLILWLVLYRVRALMKEAEDVKFERDALLKRLNENVDKKRE
eukprot:gene2596-5075_t